MKLSTKARYSVMAMVELALNENSGPLSLSYISEKHNLPLAYLEQIFLKLKKMHLVKSSRGANGGYTLGRPKKEISIKDVIKSVEDMPSATRCGGSPKGCAPRSTRCATHDLWQNLEDIIYTYMNSVTLQDVCEGTIQKKVHFISPYKIFNDSGEASYDLF